MIIKELNPNYEDQIKLNSALERSAFQLSGNDPTEFPKVLKYIGENGKTFVGYETVNKEDIPKDLAEIVKIEGPTAEIPIAFIELITLDKSIDFYNNNKSDESLVDSPFIVSKSNAGRIYEFARKYAKKDSMIVDHHGVGVHKDFQEHGCGSKLLEYALNCDFTKGKVIVCNVDIAKQDETGIVDIFNDRSFAQHLNRGFITGNILEPPIYEGTIFYASTLKIPNISLTGTVKEVNIGELRREPENLIIRMKRLHANGFVGVGYDSKKEIMYFDKIK